MRREAKKEAKRETNLRLKGANVNQKKLPESTERISGDNQIVTSNGERGNIVTQHFEIDEKKAIEELRKNTATQSTIEESKKEAEVIEYQ